jgi:translation initiation factor 4A
MTTLLEENESDSRWDGNESIPLNHNLENIITVDTGDSEMEHKEITICNSWDDFDIKHNLLRGIYAIGFEKPSPIQQKAIIPMISRRDIIAQAQSGTGKTATFSIGTLQIIDTTLQQVQAILMAPTHELAKQSSNVIRTIGSMMKQLTIQTLVGGTSVYDDANNLKNNTPHVVVGTPGRVYDMIKRNYLDTQHIRVFVMDEADDMLSAGFKEQIYNIFQYLPNEVQVALFSATMPYDIIDLSKKFMRNPIKILMKTEELTLECIKQYYIALSSDNNKYEMLKNLFSYISVSQCIIYVNSVNRVVDLYNAMCEEGFSVCHIHSSMSKMERDESFKQFKNGKYRVLISSNITARGIDIQQVSIVINFDIPRCVHTYLHRIGRGGRWGRKGTAINFVTKADIEYMKKIETHYKITIEEFPLDNASLCKPI